MSAIERILNNLLQEATAVKFLPLKNACKEALDLLESYNCPAPTHELRQKCLNCIQIALESRRTRFQAHGVNALQKLIVDDRFHSGIEPENEDQWLANQVLNAVRCTPTFHENTQVEIMKVLLQLTLSHFWCASTSTITKIAEVCLDTYATCNQASIKAAIRATLTQMLSNLSDKVLESQCDDSDDSDQEAENIISDFVGKDVENHNQHSSVTDDVVMILNFLCDKVSSTQSQTANKPLIPLLLEGIHSVLTHLPMSVKNNPQFVELLWKRLCPSLISILGNPMQDKTVHQKPNVPGETETSGRGSGCSSSAPNLAVNSMNVLYNIVIELVKFVGGLRSLRPVLESVFYRMMLYPPPQHRLEALKIVKEVLSSPEGVLSFAGPTIDDEKNSNHPTDFTKLPQSNTALLKIVIDSVQECVHCNEASVCIASVQCIDVLLKSIDQICQGEYLSDENIDDILDQFRDSELPKLSPKHQARLSPRHQFFTSQEVEDDTVDIEIKDETTDILTTTKIDGSPVKISLSAKIRDTDSPTDSIEFGLLTRTDEKEEVEEETKIEVNETFLEVERQSAREFITCLLQVLPSLLDVICVSELDESVQTFASNFCAGQQVQDKGHDGHVPILNADGVYLTTYNALSLNLKLINLDYYRHKDTVCPITANGFVEEVLDGELLLHLSDSWLKEVYNMVTKVNLLQQAGFNEQTQKQSVLFATLVDLDGLDSKQVGGQLMRSYREELEAEADPKKKRATEAGMKFARYVLALCWEGVLDVLSVLLNGKSACGVKSSVQLMLGMEGAKEENSRAREAMCTSLEGLQRAATMSCLLGLHQRCATVFDQLAQASCVIEDYQHHSPQVERRNKVVEALTHKPKLPRLHTAHTMSLDVVLNTGLEIGSHARDCWRHVFRCCSHVNHLEHLYFSRSSTSGPKTLKQDPQMDGHLDEDEFGSEMYSASLTVPTISLAPTVSVSELIKESQKEESGWDMGMKGVLNNDKTSKAICSLSQAVDHLFEDSSDKLTMKALLEFLSELCQSSKQQLLQLSKIHSKEEFSNTLPTNVLLIYRLGDVMLRMIQSDRPLMHIMKAWTIAAPHLIEAACHRDHRISKKAVTCLHEVITTLLSNHRELPHFHFNELLCKPFENLLCMELCDGDVQDQIVCSICELVEACTTEIRSGWRPLFASLRAVKIEFTASEEINEARQRHVAAVLDVFDVFLNSDNALVFSNAAVDCILCLLKYVRGPGAFEADDDDSDDEQDPSSDSNSESLCIPALQYLRQCCNILAKMWRMPACPVVTGAHRIRLLARPKMVDPVIPILDLNEYEQTFSPENSPVRKPKKKRQVSKDNSVEIEDESDDVRNDNVFEENEPNRKESKSESEERALSPLPDSLRLSPEVEEDAGKMPSKDIAEFKANNEGLHSSIKLELRPQPLDEIDNHTGILHVWFLLLEGMSHAVSASPRTFQPQTVDMLFQLLKENAVDPGPEFGIHCINHLLLPMIQEWMRRATKEYGYWKGQMNNFKQCMGLAADLVVEYVVRFSDCTENNARVEYMLKQLLDVLVECISQPIESISRLGCSCFRHTLLSGGPSFTESLWHISTQSILHAFRVSTYSLQQLMMLFSPNSTSFSGDLGGVKVAARRDCTMADTERLSHLALQVFLLDHQRKAGMPNVNEVEADRSYIFLLYPPEFADSINPDHITARVPFRSMVVGLLSHQLLLQTVGVVLLGDDAHESKRAENKLPGMLSQLSSRCIMALLQCLQESYSLACQFDTRPGLKFLIQKVARSNVAANLYRQAGVSMTFLINSLFALVTYQMQDSAAVKEVLGHHIVKMTKANDSVKLYDISNNHRDMAHARASNESFSAHCHVYVKLLFEICCEVCARYADLVTDKDLLTLADKMSHQSLFFLVAQPDDPETKKEKSFFSQLFADKIKDKRPMVETINCSTVPVQGQPDRFTPEDANSPDHEAPKNQNPDDKVYNVATDQTIKRLMCEYKRRKMQHAMPTFQRTHKPRSSSSSSLSERDALIEKEQNESIFRDAEAHIQSWTELTCTMLSLLDGLDNRSFTLLLPVVFPSVNQLICHAEDPRLKKSLSQWMVRVGELYQISATASQDQS